MLTLNYLCFQNFLGWMAAPTTKPYAHVCTQAFLVAPYSSITAAVPSDYDVHLEGHWLMNGKDPRSVKSHIPHSLFEAFGGGHCQRQDIGLGRFLYLYKTNTHVVESFLSVLDVTSVVS